MKLIYADIILADDMAADDWGGRTLCVDVAFPEVQRSVQLASYVRGTWQVPIDRYNSQVSVSFTVIKEFGSPEAAESFCFAHPLELAAAQEAGVVYVDGNKRHRFGDAVLSQYARPERTGVSVVCNYAFIYSQYAASQLPKALSVAGKTVLLTINSQYTIPTY